MKRKAWKIVLAMIGVLALCIGLLVGDAHWRAEQTIARHLKDIEVQRAATLQRNSARPSAFGEGIEGNAWDDFVPAFQSIGAIPQELLDLMPEFEPEPEINGIGPDEHAIHTLLLENKGAIELLRRGVQRRDVQLQESFLEAGSKPGYVAEALRAGRLLMGASCHEHRLGNDLQALEYAKAGLALAQDLGRRGPLIYALIQFFGEARASWALKELFESHSLGVSDLAALAAWLDRLAPLRPDQIDAWGAEDLQIRTSLANAEWESFGANSYRAMPKPTWRCLFSRRMTRAQALNQQSEFNAALQKLRPSSSWERIAKAAASENPPGDNPLYEWREGQAKSAFQSDARAQLQRGLLRVAVAAAWYESERGGFPSKIEDLVPHYLPAIPLCPLTGLPLHAANGKVWSPGKNRIDDGGVEENPDNPAEDGGDRGDVVWTVKRR